MGIFLNRLKTIRKREKINNKKIRFSRFSKTKFEKEYKSYFANEDKYCMHGQVNISKNNGKYTICIEDLRIFKSKKELYEYYFTLYKSFEDHFNRTVTIEEIDMHKVTCKGQDISIFKDCEGYYGINESLNFTGTMADCKDWFYGTLQNIRKECF